MSLEEKDEIIARIAAVADLVKWFGGGAISAFIALIILIIADHYEQASMKKDTDWMKPRVERLWYKAHPEEPLSEPPPKQNS